jgi:diguanylate cyclase (GGDEF)-like protein
MPFVGRTSDYGVRTAAKLHSFSGPLLAQCRKSVSVPPYVLIAEFDPQQTAIYRQSVERHAIEPVLVRDGIAATRVLQSRGAPILLICDLSLPGADGFSVIAELRRLSAPDKSAILVFSAHNALRAAALNLRSTLGIADVGDKNQSAEAIVDAISRTLDRVRKIEPEARSSAREDELLHKIMFRTAKAFRSPMVLLSIELRDRNKVVGHMNVDEPSGTSYFWPVLQQVSSTREPLVIPDTTKHSLFGVGLQPPALPVRAFATIPLIASSGKLVGAMCLLDLQPQTLTASQLDLLLRAGSRIAQELANYYKDELAEPDDAGAWRSKERWAALERLALTDRVTGLFNRHAGELALEREVARARRTRAAFSLVLIDIDHFKQVNDRHGHAAGDEVLKQISSILTSTFRASDLAVRWGGDEFLVFLPDVPMAGAMVFAERARTQVEALSFDQVGAVTMSAGIAQVRPDEDARAAIRRADAQLYEAKRLGRNLVKMAATAS